MDDEDPATQLSEPDRQELAEQWRVIGKRLSERSPELFEKLLVMITVSAVGAENDTSEDISETYTVC